MRRESRMRPDDVVALRLRLADKPPGMGPDAGTWVKADTLPPGGVTDDERLWGRRAVARFTMLRTHGCTGESCQRRLHSRDAGQRDEALAALGLGGER